MVKAGRGVDKARRDVCVSNVRRGWFSFKELLSSLSEIIPSSTSSESLTMNTARLVEKNIFLAAHVVHTQYAIFIYLFLEGICFGTLFLADMILKFENTEWHNKMKSLNTG